MSAEYAPSQLTYLEHLGIDVWQPRCEQVEIQASQPATEQSEIQQPDVPQEQPLVQHKPSVPHAATSVDTQVVSTPTVNSVAAPAYPLQPEQPVKAETPQFTLHYWCYRSGLWIVTSESELTPEHHKFVHNVAQFIQGSRSKPKHVGMFNWPMLEAPNVDQSAEVAKKYLAEHLHQLTQMVKPSNMLCFAESPQWLTDFAVLEYDISISEIMASAGNKQQLWQYLVRQNIGNQVT